MYSLNVAASKSVLVCDATGDVAMPLLFRQTWKRWALAGAVLDATSLAATPSFRIMQPSVSK